MKSPDIRFASPRDLPRIIELCQAHAAFEKASYQVAGKAALLKKYFFETPVIAYCLLVEINQQVVGYATFMKQFSTWDAHFYLYLDCLYFEPQARGLGFGKKVMEHVKTFAKAENCTEIQWQTPDFNKKAIRFYDKLGAVSKTKERFIWLV
ncbi:MAG: GNAT family N-acetyltransferase [Bacteroidota bacterium]